MLILNNITGMRTLGKRIAPGASHNSAERFDPPKCHPKTREAVLKDIMDWIQGLGEVERRHYFMWLYGPAGAGKSAIAQTIAELCYELKLPFSFPGQH
jgi:DNA replication protein DnaC